MGSDMYMNPPRSPRHFVEWDGDDLVVKLEVFDYGPPGMTEKGIYEVDRYDLSNDWWRAYTERLLKAVGVRVPTKPGPF
jgi:hypothetical protein